jgi:hypothetical protein
MVLRSALDNRGLRLVSEPIRKAGRWTEVRLEFAISARVFPPHVNARVPFGKAGRERVAARVQPEGQTIPIELRCDGIGQRDPLQRDRDGRPRLRSGGLGPAMVIARADVR